MLPIIQIGPLALQTQLIIMLVGVMLGVTFAEKYSSFSGIKPDDLNRLVFTGLMIGLLGGRLSYFLMFPAAFLSNPISIISPNPELFRLGDVLIFAVFGALVYGSRKRMPLWNTLDALTPFFLLLWIAYGLANYAVGNDYGIVTSVSWGINLWGAHRHPTQLYDLIFAFSALFILLPGKKSAQIKPLGWNFLCAAALCALSRLTLAPFRGESYLLPGGFRMEQLTAWIILLGSLILMRRISLDFRRENPENDHGCVLP